MARNRGKQHDHESAVYRSLLELMSLPGKHQDMFSDLLPAIMPSDDAELKRALLSPNYDDRTAALVYGSMVEHSLETAIATHFSITDPVSVFSYTEDGALATFSAKIAMGFALGIYAGALRHNLKWIKHIRNAFAHARVKLDFSTPEIIESCALLSHRTITDASSEPYTVRHLAPRQQFTLTSMMAAMYLRSGKPNQPLRCRESLLYRVWERVPGDEMAEYIAEKISDTTKSGSPETG